MIWRFSDGTTVELGGKVEGASWFAQELRRMLSERAPPIVATHPPPQRGTPLDVNDATLLDMWLEYRVANAPAHLRVRLTERPEGIAPFRALTDEELGLHAPPGAIF